MFVSERLRLRKMSDEDIRVYHTWRNNIDVMNSTSPALDLYTYEETKRFVESVILNTETSKSYIIEEKKANQPIGITSLIHIDMKNRNAECIIDIGDQNSWGKGYGTEAFTLLLDYAFLELNLHRVFLRVFSANHKAIRLYEKLGFKHEGSSREALYREGKWQDIVQMGLLKKEYT